MKNIDKILTTPVSRRQFLIYLGLGLLALTGISGFIKKLSDPDSFSLRKKASPGFGSGAYGGKEKA